MGAELVALGRFDFVVLIDVEMVRVAVGAGR